MKKQILEFIEERYKGSLRFLKPNMFRDKFGANGVTEIIDKTPFLVDVPFPQRVYCYLNDITSQPVCRVCHVPVKYNTNNGFQKYCCNTCRIKDIQNIQNIKRKTNLERYGSTNVLASTYGINRRKKTCLEKYGVDNYVKSEEYKTRLKTGNIVRVYDKDKNTEESRKRNYERLFTKYPTLIPEFAQEEYKGSNSYEINYKWRCKVCDTAFEHWLNNNYPVLCPTCKPSGTYYENVLKQFLTKHNIQYNFRDRKQLDGYEIDFYLPQYNVGIEVHGLYWHSEKNITDKKYHLKKLNECLEKNIKLIQIFEDELYEKQNIVLHRIKHYCGVQKYKIPGRKCVVKKLDTKTKEKFFNKYHIQGNASTSINYGLFFKNRLVAALGISKLRKVVGSSVEENVYELVRYCTVGAFAVVGGGSKLLTYFLRNHKVYKIISYADRRWSQGNFYKQLGFALEKITEPNYWYTKNYVSREHRFNFQKHLLHKKIKNYNPELTERENMDANGYTRVWDCGHLKYVLENKYIHDK